MGGVARRKGSRLAQVIQKNDLLQHSMVGNKTSHCNKQPANHKNRLRAPEVIGGACCPVLRPSLA
eukprot:2633225-Pyramimonas_sp.AAC.1